MGPPDLNNDKHTNCADPTASVIVAYDEVNRNDIIHNGWVVASHEIGWVNHEFAGQNEMGNLLQIVPKN